MFLQKAVLDIAGRLEEWASGQASSTAASPRKSGGAQIRMFSGHETKVVVATDAIGMGLNLPVKRIVFVHTSKFDGKNTRPLLAAEIKQIGGRAGRYGIYDTGYVNAVGQEGLDYIKEHFDEKEPDVSCVSLAFPRSCLIWTSRWMRF